MSAVNSISPRQFQTTNAECSHILNILFQIAFENRLHNYSIPMSFWVKRLLRCASLCYISKVNDYQTIFIPFQHSLQTHFPKKKKEKKTQKLFKGIEWWCLIFSHIEIHLVSLSPPVHFMYIHISLLQHAVQLT